MRIEIRTGDCRDLLRTMPDESVHCVVTSPPYWGLRDYGTARWEGGSAGCAHRKPATGSTQNKANNNSEGTPFREVCGLCGARRVDQQLGMEPTLGEHVENMVEVFREVRRILRSDGTLWLNYGDSYATSVNGRSAADTKATGNDDRTFRDKPFSTVGPIFRPGNPDKNGGQSNRNGLMVDAGSMLKPKDLCGIPWRVAFALQADGWWLRQDIIWAKPNPMPESIRDRCTKAHEYLFLLAKSERYFFDQDAIAENSVDWNPENTKMPDGWATHDGAHGPVHVDGREKGKRVDLAAKAEATPRNDGERWNENGGRGFIPKDRSRPKGYFKGKWSEPNPERSQSFKVIGEKRNRRSVWTVPTQSFSEAHFATFPPQLIEPCILAGCALECCAACGAPWQRIVEFSEPSKPATRGQQPWTANTPGNNRDSVGGLPLRARTTRGFAPTCSCDADVVAGTVLDPFGGAGTTGLVADRLGRNAIMLELNPDYAAMARDRIVADAGMFAEVAEGGHHVSDLDGSPDQHAAPAVEGGEDSQRDRDDPGLWADAERHRGQGASAGLDGSAQSDQAAGTGPAAEVPQQEAQEAAARDHAFAGHDESSAATAAAAAAAHHPEANRQIGMPLSNR